MLEEEQVTYFAGWLKKKKSHKIQNLEINAERPVTAPRPGWRRHRSAPAPGGEVGGAGILHPGCSAAGRGLRARGQAVLTKSTSQQLWELSSRVLSLEALVPPSGQSSVTFLSPVEPRELSGPPGKRSGRLGGWEPRTWLLRSHQKMT